MSIQKRNSFTTTFVKNIVYNKYESRLNIPGVGVVAGAEVTVVVSETNRW